MDEEDINEIVENADNLPQEVKDFIFGDVYEDISKELSSLVVNETEKNDLPNEVILFVIGIKTSEDLISYVSSLTTAQENKERIKKIIDEKVILDLLLTIEVNEEIDSEAATEDTTTLKPDIPIALTSLADRLKKASIAAPAKRDYSALQSPTTMTEPSIQTETPVKPVIDPYHEQIGG
jgi:hypothetical protein